MARLTAVMEAMKLDVRYQGCVRLDFSLATIRDVLSSKLCAMDVRNHNFVLTF